MPGDGGGSFSGKRYNGLLEDGLAMWESMKANMDDAIHADGYPPFSTPTDPQREFEKLNAQRLEGDPNYYGSKAAMGRWAALAPRYNYLGGQVQPGLLGDMGVM